MRQNFRRVIVALLGALVCLTALIFIINLRGEQEEPLKEPLAKPSTLTDLAYDEQPQFGYVIYIEEGDAYQPYYVLTSSYNEQQGATLLLRKYLLNEPREYKPYGTDSAYYENSSIDQFLSTDFYETLSPVVQEHILESTIAIADRSTLASTTELTINIARKVFLLAMAELVGYDRLMQDEGAQLKYFQDLPRNAYMAQFANGQAGTWWTRSASMWGSTSVWIIDYNSAEANAQTGYLLGVRPAFCLPGDLPVKLQAGIIPSNQVYVVDWPG